jgi:hypothetical protein
MFTFGTAVYVVANREDLARQRDYCLSMADAQDFIYRRECRLADEIDPSYSRDPMPLIAERNRRQRNAMNALDKREYFRSAAERYNDRIHGR